MNFENFKNTVENTRSTRRFKKDVTIDKRELIELIDIARTVSSGKNMQPLKYIAITDKKTKDEIYKPLVWAAHLTHWNQNKDEKPSAYILIVNDTSIEGFSSIDSGIAMQTIMLGATSKGYAGCILASIDKIKYKELFNLDNHLEPMFIIALGVKDENIEVVDVQNDTNYYRDNNNTHFVPKRKLSEVLITGND
ncbi:MAG: nitroreductase [Epsilonproteobacteria bacterium]|nr:MAG: nitroreductase [Campylobacterota bacterium]